MFTAQERAAVSSELLDFAAKDERIKAAAVTGSAANAREDEWSDVDLAFGVGSGAELQRVLSDWTRHMYERYLAVHHVDVLFGPWTYRVFLLPSTLQVDLAFVVENEFRALAPSFRLVFGKANEPRHTLPTEAETIIGMAWLFALHARSSIARQKPWQAEYMISGIRNQALALACIKHGLPAVHGRGVDLLPAGVTAQFHDSLVQRCDSDEVSRAFQTVVVALIEQIRSVDEAMAIRLQGTLKMLADIQGKDRAEVKVRF